MKPSPMFKIAIIIVLLIAFFVVLNLPTISKEIKNFFYFISAPIQKTFWGAGDNVSDFFEAVSGIRNLKKESENLEFRIQELSAEIARLRDLEKENKVLREALGIGLQEEFKIVFAQITGKDIAQDSILIDKGLKHGISKDNPVITQQKVLLGKISQVYKNFSRVMLISNKESAFPVNIQTSGNNDPLTAQTDIKAIAKGRGALQLLLDFVPRDVEIRAGDKIVTTALEGIFPKGLLAGYVKEIEKSDVEPFQQAEIQPAFEIKELENLFIIIEF